MINSFSAQFVMWRIAFYWVGQIFVPGILVSELRSVNWPVYFYRENQEVLKFLFLTSLVLFILQIISTYYVPGIGLGTGEQTIQQPLGNGNSSRAKCSDWLHVLIQSGRPRQTKTTNKFWPVLPVHT